MHNVHYSILDSVIMCVVYVPPKRNTVGQVTNVQSAMWGCVLPMLQGVPHQITISRPTLY